MSYPSGPVMVWELAGRPRRDSIRPEPVAGVCAMCGRQVDESLPTAKAIGGNFTDQYLLSRPDSPRICYACTWVCSGKPPDTVRMWTVAAAPGRGFGPSHPKSPGWGNRDLLLTARNDMRQVVSLLADPPDGPWLVSVAESGQKHHLPYARINHGRGRWTVRMDAVDVVATHAQYAHVFGHVAALRKAGYTAAEIEQLTPPVHKLRRRFCETSAQRAARAAELEQRAAALEDRAWRTRTGEAPIWESVTKTSGGCPGLQAGEESGFPRSGAGKADSPPGEPASPAAVPSAVSNR